MLLKPSEEVGAGVLIVRSDVLHAAPGLQTDVGNGDTQCNHDFGPSSYLNRYIGRQSVIYILDRNLFG